jgi:ubiquinone/menaquinone biosynthesis C-methylase UbiE
MSQSDRWQLVGNAPEVYETELVPAIFEPWATLLVAKAALREGERVLDVACGTGVVTRLVPPQVGITGQVIGLDLNPGMLARARLSPPPDDPAVEWREGDAGALPFGAATFDVIFSQFGFQYFPDRHQAAREMYRVLKPEGRLIIMVWRGLAHSPGFAALAAALERHVSSSAAAVMRAPFAFGDSTDELRALLAQAGFRRILVSADVRMVRFPSPGAFVQYQVAGSPLATHVAEVSDADRDEMIREVSTAMQPYVNDEGLAFPVEGHIAVAHP